jgi:cytochrome c-type biogenesis protein CcmH
MRWPRLHRLVLRSPRRGCLEGHFRRASRAHSTVPSAGSGQALRDAPPAAPLLRTRSWRLTIALLGALLASLAGPALAVQPDEVMKDPALETRARALSGELRCLVCQNESIDDSEAPLARDIRILIRERIGKGESNDSVRAYLVSRYGDFILLKPPFKPETLLLWLSPVLTLGLGVAAALYARRRAPSATPRLSDDEEARLAALTNGDASNG